MTHQDAIGCVRTG